MQTLDPNPTATTTKPVTEPVKEPVTAPVTEPVTAPVAEPVTKPVTEPVVEPVTPPATETPDGPQSKNYKDYVKRIETQNKALKAQVLDNHITGIGLDPTTGLGVAVRDAYSGDEFTIEAVATFAKEKYGHVAQAPDTPAVTEVRTQQQVVDVVTDIATSVVPTNEQSKELVTRENKMNAPEGTAQDAAHSLTAKVAAFRTQNP